MNIDDAAAIAREAYTDGLIDDQTHIADSLHRYTQHQFCADAGDLFLKREDEDNGDLAWSVKSALKWAEMECTESAYSSCVFAERLMRVGRIVIENAIANGLTSEQLEGLGDVER